MSMMESIEFFPLFNADAGEAAPRVSVAVGSGVAAIGSPDAFGGGGAVVLYCYSPERNAWGYVGLVTGSRVGGIKAVRGLGSACVAFGDTVILGAPGDRDTPGQVFVLSPPYGRWTYTALPVISGLTAREPARGDQFGTSVAHCSDGTEDYIAVGAPGVAPPRGRTAAGQVFIFKGLESAEPWSTSAIGNPNPAGTDADQFGACVAINLSSDGSNHWDGTLTLAVGAPGADEGQGAVYVGRTTDPGKWTSFQFGEPLVPTFADAAEDFRTSGFGGAIALTGGATLAVGSPNDPNFDDMIEDTGAVWIFNYVDGSFAENKNGTRLYGSAEGRILGTSVAFPETIPLDTGEGKLVLPQAEFLLVGAPGAVAGEPACAYVYANDPESEVRAGETFALSTQLVNSSRQEGDRFAASVAASGFENGSWSFIGVPQASGAGVDGGGYLYVHGDPAPTWMDAPDLIEGSALRWGGADIDSWKRFTPRIEKYLT
jgi:hypothetical protein